MSRKPTLTEVTDAMARAGRVGAKGAPAEQAGQFVVPDEPEGDEGTTGDELVLYETGKGLKVELNFSGDTMWATQQQMADLFNVTQASVSRHLKNIYGEGELDQETSYTESVYQGVNGQSRNRRLYNLDAIISVGYRVNSKQGTMFRRWATGVLVEYAKKGFALDDQRLKEPGGNDYFAELRERIRDIRASEANVYKELREVCTLCSDYDPNQQSARNFFAGLQNKMLWAVTTNTAPQLIMDRADASKPNMGLTSWKGRDVAKADVKTAKNYLGDQEIAELNRLTNMTLDYIEDQTQRRRVVTMVELEEQIREFIKFNKRPLLGHNGSVTRAKADKHALAEYEKFAEARRLARQAEGEKTVAKLLAVEKSAPVGRRKRSN